MAGHSFGYGHGQFSEQAQYQQSPYAFDGLAGSYEQPTPSGEGQEHSLPDQQHRQQQHYAISQTSFEYNSSRIPGLGITGTPTHPMPYYPSSDATGHWASNPTYSPNAPALHNPYANPVQPTNPPVVQSFRTSIDSADAPMVLDSSSAGSSDESSSSSSMDIEDGEVSEGQSDDVFVTGEVHHVEAPRRPALVSSSHAAETRDASVVVDTPDVAFYGNDDEPTPIEGNAQTQAETTAGRERTGSYSPYLSPREIDGEPDDAKAVDKLGESKKDLRRPLAGLEGPSPAAKSQAAPEGAVGSPINPPQPRSSQVGEADQGSHVAFKNLAEAKKEAAKAILRLWPLGVKFQNYIDEGIDESLIKSLFGDLHLEIPKPPAPAKGALTKSALPSKPPQAIPARRETASDSKPEHITAAATTATVATNAATVVATTTGITTKAAASATSSTAPKPAVVPPMPGNSVVPGEERKDRIARLLAAKKNKPPPIAPPPPQPSTANKPSAPVPAPPQLAENALSAVPAVANGKSKILRAKIEEKLRILNEQRAKADRERGAASPAVEPSSTKQANSSADQAKPDILLATTASPPPDAPRRPANVRSQSSGPIPGLFMSSTAQPVDATPHRKRPVASDFVSYSSSVGPVKRPFARTRADSSLVIEISDAEDEEDDDVDMDLDSGEDDSSKNATRGATPLRKGPSIRDFPPLSDTATPRQFSSPAPPAPSGTPPVSSSALKKKETELQMKEKQIEKMRRQIAELEAKKSKKSSAEPQAHSGTGATSSEVSDSEPSGALLQKTQASGRTGVSITPSAQLLAEARSAPLPNPAGSERGFPQVKSEQRGRIVSVDLPRIDDRLQEKRMRLEQLRAQEALVQAEIDAELAERKRLSDELAQIEDDSTEDANKPNGHQAGTDSVATPQDDEPESTSNASSGRETAEADQDPTVAEPPLAGDHVSDGKDLETLSRSNLSEEAELSNSRAILASNIATEPESAVESVSVVTELLDPMTTVVPIPAVVNDGSQHTFEDIQMRDASPPKQASLVPSSDSSNANVPAIVGVVDNTTAALPDVGSEEGEIESDFYEQQGTTPKDEANQLPAELSNVGPEQNKDESDERETTDFEGAVGTPISLPGQISSTAQPREDLQEIEEVTVGEVHPPLSTKPHGSFVPYESPLKAFHAYRFHPQFKETVPGGYRSLTYTNKINYLMALCPFELEGKPCAQGDDCPFQHLRDIAVADDQILVELGKADDITDRKRKDEFVQGLRQLLTTFRAQKVRDFNTISEGIIRYRQEFFGDKSRILPLDNITL